MRNESLEKKKPASYNMPTANFTCNMEICGFHIKCSFKTTTRKTTLLACSIGHFGKYHNTHCLCPQILHKHSFQFLLRLTMVPRENKNNAYAKIWGDIKRVLWYFPNWPIERLFIFTEIQSRSFLPKKVRIQTS